VFIGLCGAGALAGIVARRLAVPLDFAIALNQPRLTMHDKLHGYGKQSEQIKKKALLARH